MAAAQVCLVSKFDKYHKSANQTVLAMIASFEENCQNLAAMPQNMHVPSQKRQRLVAGLKHKSKQVFDTLLQSQTAFDNNNSKCFDNINVLIDFFTACTTLYRKHTKFFDDTNKLSTDSDVDTFSEFYQQTAKDPKEADKLTMICLFLLGHPPDAKEAVPTIDPARVMSALSNYITYMNDINFSGGTESVQILFSWINSVQQIKFAHQYSENTIESYVALMQTHLLGMDDADGITPSEIILQ